MIKLLEPTPSPPELIDYMNATFDMDAFNADIEDIKRSGGRTLDEFIGEIEAKVRAKQ